MLANKVYAVVFSNGHTKDVIVQDSPKAYKNVWYSLSDDERDNVESIEYLSDIIN